MKQVLFLRIVCILEALSYLGLLAYAMPMRALYGRDDLVSWFGRAHGVLVIVFCVALFLAMERAKWSLKTAFLIFLASLVPVVPFFIEPWLKREQKRLAEAKS